MEGPVGGTALALNNVVQMWPLLDGMPAFHLLDPFDPSKTEL
jgi:hypothetical protein